MTTNANRAVFLDRDGTIAQDVPYCSRPEDFVLFPQVAESIRLLNENAFKVILITNQSGIARGYFTEDDLTSIHDKMSADLARAGAWIDAVYFCPHHPDDNCDCRKPSPALVHRAAAEWEIELKKSFFIGDAPKDIQTGKATGCRTVLVGNETITPEATPDYRAADFPAAVAWVLSTVGQNRTKALK